MPTIDDVQLALSWQRLSEDWLKEGGKFVPHPATYLNARRWEDEKPTGPKRSSVPEPRCSFHRAAGTARRKPSDGWVISCSICKKLEEEEICQKPDLSDEQRHELAEHRRRLKRGGFDPETSGNALDVIQPPAPRQAMAGIGGPTGESA